MPAFPCKRGRKLWGGTTLSTRAAVARDALLFKKQLVFQRGVLAIGVVAYYISKSIIPGRRCGRIHADCGFHGVEHFCIATTARIHMESTI